MGPSRAGLRRGAQPESALPLLEPVERLAGDPVVAAPLQVPAGRFRTEQPAGAGDDAVPRPDTMTGREHQNREIGAQRPACQVQQATARNGRSALQAGVQRCAVADPA